MRALSHGDPGSARRLFVPHRVLSRGRPRVGAALVVGSSPMTASLDLDEGHVVAGPPPRGEAYTLGARWGEGGFGTTHLATTRAGQRVIVKQLRVDRMKDWKALDLFEREAATLASLRHPRIPSYFDFFAYDGARALPPSALRGADRPMSLLLVQSFVEGETLDRALARGERFDDGRAERLLRELLAILVHLHGLRPPVVHRDINPRNVILGPSGEPFLVDFGAVQDRIRLAAVGSTSVGTAGYMPIEQAMGTARPASDLFALGVTVLQAISGVPPTEMPLDDDTAKIRVDELASAVSPALRRALSAMVEPAIGRRAESAEDVLALLDTPEPIPARGASKMPFVALAVAGTGFAGLLGGLLLFRGKAPPAPPPVGDRVSPPTAVDPRPQARRDEKPTAPAPQAVALPLTFSARVVSADAMVAPGASCTVAVQAQIAAGDVRAMKVKVTCGKVDLYDGDDPLEGTSQSSWGLDEVPDPKTTALRYQLLFNDQGTRSGKRGQILADSKVGEAVVWREALPSYRVKLSLAKLSEPREGSPLLKKR